MSNVTVEDAVTDRYSESAKSVEDDLCCPVDYDPQYLEVIPDEIIEKDYGCGDPSQYLREGDTVLDLGSGAGKICYIASQVVGESGRVIGVDMNREMLDLARKYNSTVSDAIGYDNVEFYRGKIQDLKLDFEQLEEKLLSDPVASADDFLETQQLMETLREEATMVPDASVDVIISNCVLNLVRDEDKQKLFSEMHRVLKKGGRVAISDIVSDEPVPEEQKQDPELWSDCISGAFQEQDFLEAFEEAGFYGMSIEKWEDEPFRVVDGIEYRAVTVTGRKGKEGPCLERNQAVVYKGPYSKIHDDDGHVYPRGTRVAVCDKTFKILKQSPYSEDFVFIEPHETVPIDEAGTFPTCNGFKKRSPQETKGANYSVTTNGDEACC